MTHSPEAISSPARPARRAILVGLTAIAGSTVAPVARPSCESDPLRKNGDRQGKFDAQGQARHWPGNTVICPIGQTDPLFGAMCAFNTLITRDWTDVIVPTPLSSYHMTVLGGFDPEQERHGNWPADIARHTPLENVTRIMRDRLASRHFDLPDRIEMEIDPDRRHAPLVGVPLRPASAAMATALYALRRELSDTLRFVPDDINSYMFHATYGYRYRPVSRARKHVLRQAIHDLRKRLHDQIGTIILPEPVFCSFETMLAFQPHLTLNETT